MECYLRKLKQAGQAESSVHQIRAFLHRACRLARKWSGNRLPNPVADTDLPEWALSERPKHVRAPELGEVRAVLAATRRYDRRVATFIRVVAASGARRGEVCALRWSDIDWDRCSVRIDEAVVADDGGVVVKGPKNRASVGGHLAGGVEGEGGGDCRGASLASERVDQYCRDRPPMRSTK